MSGRQFSFPSLSSAIAAPDQLPKDLLSAFNAAVFFARTAEEVYYLLVNLDSDHSPEPVIFSVLEKLAKLEEYRELARQAVGIVSDDIPDIRERLSQLRNLGVASAHWLALETADRLRNEIWKAADPEGWIRCCFDKTARMDPISFRQNVLEVSHRLRGCSLFSCGPVDSFDSLLAQIQVEARITRDSRGGPGHTSGATRTQEPQIQRDDPGETSRPVLDGTSELDDRERELLQAMLLLGATGERTCRKMREIAKKADPTVKGSTYKHPNERLVKHGLVKTKTGSSGGSWLTPAGLELAKQLSKGQGGETAANR